jgi:hypothetical protein
LPSCARRGGRSSAKLPDRAADFEGMHSL